MQTEFDGVTRDGREIVIRVAIGDIHDVTTDHGDPTVGVFIEVEPLMKRRRQQADDSFGAVCFAIELVRAALKIFVAHGGAVYFRNTRAPIDLTSPHFEPIGGLLLPEYQHPDLNPDAARDQFRPMD
jgi:hypothetical protein